ncbi:MAG: hypothetical protein GEU73_04415 [Chloroflexi bacterium]|nr:hypothetical protein [Chloroflexota bacterium]
MQPEHVEKLIEEHDAWIAEILRANQDLDDRIASPSEVDMPDAQPARTFNLSESASIRLTEREAFERRGILSLHHVAHAVRP